MCFRILIYRIAENIILLLSWLLLATIFVGKFRFTGPRNTECSTYVDAHRIQDKYTAVKANGIARRYARGVTFLTENERLR